MNPKYFVAAQLFLFFLIGGYFSLLSLYPLSARCHGGHAAPAGGCGRDMSSQARDVTCGHGHRHFCRLRSAKKGGRPRQKRGNGPPKSSNAACQIGQAQGTAQAFAPPGFGRIPMKLHGNAHASWSRMLMKRIPHAYEKNPACP